MKSLWTFLTRDPLRKLIALCLTIVLYAVLNEGKQREEVVDVPLVIKCENDVFLSDLKRAYVARVTVRGSESRIKKLDVQQISGMVVVTRNTPGFGNGRVTLRLTARDFSCPQGIEVVRVEQPQELTFAVQRRVNRQLEIKPVLIGKVPSGWSLVDCDVIPAVVSVSGPEELLNGLDSIKTEELDINNDTENFTKKLKLINPNRDLFQVHADEVLAAVQINKTPNLEWEVPGVAVRFIHDGNTLRINAVPDKVTVRISGRQDMVRQITAHDITVVADVSEPEFLLPGEYRVKLRALLRNNDGNLRILSIEPAEIKVISSPVENVIQPK